MKLDLLNMSALLLALALATLGAGWAGPAGAPSPRGRPAAPHAERSVELLADGTRALRDARGVLVPLHDYRRIASGALVADRVLVDLCEPARLLAFSRYAEQTPLAFRYAGKPKLGARDDVERVLALKPDLLILSDLVEPSYVARLEERGIRVFVLRPMLGLRSLLPDIRALGQLIGAGGRADAYARALQRRLDAVARGVAQPTPPRTLYLSIYGDKLFASGDATSYHDVIHYAGLSDAAGAAGLRGWPELSGEQVLALDPDVLLTRTGMSGLLCRHPGLALLRPCQPGGRLIELDGALLDDPGPAMLEAAEALHEASSRR
jgi:iron complex transport system substrate-binding protein